MHSAEFVVKPTQYSTPGRQAEDSPALNFCNVARVSSDGAGESIRTYFFRVLKRILPESLCMKPERG